MCQLSGAGDASVGRGDRFWFAHHHWGADNQGDALSIILIVVARWQWWWLRTGRFCGGSVVSRWCLLVHREWRRRRRRRRRRRTRWARMLLASLLLAQGLLSFVPLGLTALAAASSRMLRTAGRRRRRPVAILMPLLVVVPSLLLLLRCQQRQ
jgi:hypothetical protein